MSDQKFFLSYWVRGQSLHRARVVAACPDTLFNTLRQDIEAKAKISVHNIYKVPSENAPKVGGVSFSNFLGNLSVSALDEPLPLTQKVSDYFPSPPPDCLLHLIVDSSSLVITCWLRGTKPWGFFSVKCAKNDPLGSVKRAIIDVRKLPTYHLRLYKVTDGELDECLEAEGTGSLLKDGELVYTVFEDIPFSESPGIIVELRSNLLDARRKFLAHTHTNGASAYDCPSLFETRQLGSYYTPCGRPRYLGDSDDKHIPVTLLHPVFALFIEDSRSIGPTANDHLFTSDLGHAMIHTYENENARVCEINAILERYGITLNSNDNIVNTKFTGDSSTTLVLGGHDHRYMIVGFKDDACSNGIDPYLQAIVYYLESTRTKASEYPDTLPCMLIVIFRSYMVFAGAAWNRRPVVETLSVPIGLRYHPKDLGNHNNATRHMAAFRKALDSLGQHYHADLANTGMSLAQQIFPYKNSYESLHGEGAIKFRYEREACEGKLTFFARKVSSRERLRVSFSRTYSKDAHEYLASIGHAPVLRGLEMLPGDWIMTVFDALDGFETISDRAGRLPKLSFDAIAATLDRFHKAGFVHGDFRQANILVSAKDATDFKIVGFDWAGRKGEVLYPPFVDTTDSERPESKLDGKPILVDHDLFMLDQMRMLYE